MRLAPSSVIAHWSSAHLDSLASCVLASNDLTAFRPPRPHPVDYRAYNTVQRHVAFHTCLVSESLTEGIVGPA
jgi:hypothetical protein